MSRYKSPKEWLNALMCAEKVTIMTSARLSAKSGIAAFRDLGVTSCCSRDPKRTPGSSGRQCGTQLTPRQQAATTGALEQVDAVELRQFRQHLVANPASDTGAIRRFQ